MDRATERREEKGEEEKNVVSYSAALLHSSKHRVKNLLPGAVLKFHRGNKFPVESLPAPGSLPAGFLGNRFL